MGMSTHVIGFKPPDQKWKDMKAIWDTCNKADIEVPEDVGDFFGWEEPDVRGVETEIPMEEWQDIDGAGMGYEIEVAKIPKGVKFLRFYNSW